MEITRRLIEINDHLRIKVFNEAGAEEAGEWSIRYDEEYDKLKGLEAHTITPDGKEHRVEKKTIFKKTVGDYTEETFAFPYIVPGSILEVKYRLRSDTVMLALDKAYHIYSIDPDQFDQFSLWRKKMRDIASGYVKLNSASSQ